MLLAIAPVVANAADKEQLVKAAFLYNFTKFVSWPGDLAISNRSGINICVIGSNSLGDATSVFKQGSTPTLSINAKILSALPTAAGECHIAFIGASAKASAGSLVKSLHAMSILTVSDIDDFADNGGIIGFINENNKIRLVVNKAAAEAAGLKVDAQLLEIARKVIQ